MKECSRFWKEITQLGNKEGQDEREVSIKAQSKKEALKLGLSSTRT